MKYHAIPLSIVVKPEKDSIDSEMVTVVALENGCPGHYVSVKQPDAHVDKSAVHIASEEWPLVRDTIEKMLALCEKMDGGGY